MSQFLGPIHHVMYRKICLLQGWEEACVSAATAAWGETRVTDLLSPVAAKRWQPAGGELASLIGDQPIHGWLQEQLNRAESSLAAVVSALDGGNDDSDALLRAASFADGRRVAETAEFPPGADTAPMQTLAAVLSGCYLDGMPCDQVSEVVEMDPRRLVVRRMLEIHRANWRAGGADPETMIALQGAWSAGLAAGVAATLQHQRAVKPIAGMLACVDTFVV